MINDLFIQTIDVVGRALRHEIEATTPGGIHSLTNNPLQLWLYNRLGTPSESDIYALRRSTGFRFTSSVQFGQDAAKLKSIYPTLQSLQASVAMIDQVHQLEVNCSHLSHVTEAIGRYKLTTALANRNYDGLVTAVLRDLQRLPETTTGDYGFVGLVKDISESTTSTTSATTATTTIHPPLPQQQMGMTANNAVGRVDGGRRGGRVNERGNRGGGRGRGRGFIYGPAARGTAVGENSIRYYCFAHGKNKTHSGMQCDLMARDSRYTLPMRQATTQCTIDGYQGAPSSEN